MWALHKQPENLWIRARTNSVVFCTRKVNCCYLSAFGCLSSRWCEACTF